MSPGPAAWRSWGGRSSRGQDRGSRHQAAVVTSAGMPFFSELLLGLDGGLDAVDPRATWEVNLLPGSHDGPGLGSVPVRVAGMPQGELACVRVEVEEVAVASPIEQGPLGAGGWLWLTCAGSMALPTRTFRVLTPREPSSCKEHRRHVNRLPGGRCPAAQNSPIGTQPCVRHPSQWPAQIGDRRSPDTNDHAELPIVVPQEACRPAHNHALIRRALFGYSDALAWSPR